MAVVILAGKTDVSAYRTHHPASDSAMSIGDSATNPMLWTRGLDPESRHRVGDEDGVLARRIDGTERVSRYRSVLSAGTSAFSG